MINFFLSFDLFSAEAHGPYFRTHRANMVEPKGDPKKKGGAAGTQGQATIAEAEGAAALLTGGAATSSGSRGSIPLGLFGAIPPSIQSIEEEDLSDPIVMFSKAMNTNMKDKEQFVENMYKLSGSMQELMIYDEPTVRRCLERMFENGIESVKDVLKMKQKITNVFIVPEKDRTDDITTERKTDTEKARKNDTHKEGKQ